MTQIIPRDEGISDPLSDEHRARIWCKVRRLTVMEGIEYMRKCGYKIKKDRYNQLMTEINRNINKSLLYQMQNRK